MLFLHLIIFAVVIDKALQDGGKNLKDSVVNTVPSRSIGNGLCIVFTFGNIFAHGFISVYLRIIIIYRKVADFPVVGVGRIADRNVIAVV